MNSERLNLTSPELIKNKYYKAEEVNVLLKNCTDILKRLQAENQTQKKEIATLKVQCTELTNQKNEVSDALVSSKIVARQIITEAKTEAQRILAESETEAKKIKETAEHKAKNIIDQAEKEASLEKQKKAEEEKTAEKILSKTAESFARLKEEQIRVMDQIDEEWKELLIQIYGNENTENKTEINESTETTTMQSESEAIDEETEKPEFPDDISEKVEAIARQLKIFTDTDDEE